MNAWLRAFACLAVALVLTACTDTDDKYFWTPAPLVGVWTTADYLPSANRVTPKTGSVLYVYGKGEAFLFGSNGSTEFLALTSYRPLTKRVSFFENEWERLSGPGYLEPRQSFVFAFEPKPETLTFLKLTGKGELPPLVPPPGYVYRRNKSLPLPAPDKMPTHPRSIVR